MIIFRKSGNFYQVFDDDAIILHSLFKYKINEIIDRITFEKFFSSSINYLYTYKCSKIKLRRIINNSINNV